MNETYRSRGISCNPLFNRFPSGIEPVTVNRSVHDGKPSQAVQLVQDIIDGQVRDEMIGILLFSFWEG